MSSVLVLGPYYLHPVLDRDSVINVIPDLFRAIRGSGRVPLFVTADRNSDLPDILQETGGPCTLVRVVSPRPNGIHRLRFIAAAARRATSSDVEAITNICGAISYGFDALIASRLARVRCVVRVSGDEIMSRLHAGRYRGWKGMLVKIADRLRQRIVLRFADGVIVMSERERQRVAGIRGTDSGVFVAPRGVNTLRFMPPVSYEPHEPLRVLFVGRRSLEKGYDIFLNIAERLAHDPRFCFTMVGDFPPQERGNLHVLSYVDPREMPSVYAKHDVLLMTSRSEGFPQAMAEGMAAGLLPVVPRHLFEGNFEQGAVLVSLDVSSIVAALVELVADRPRIETGRMKARDVALHDLDSEACALQYAFALGISGSDDRIDNNTVASRRKYFV